MAHIRIGEELFNVAVDGPREAPVLMLSNSLGADLSMWDPQIPALTQKYRVIRYDSRGHGQSVADPGAYTIERLGRDALAILDKLGVDKTHWVGLSKGGMVGQWLLAHAPSRILRAVLANTSAHMGGGDDVWAGRARAATEHGMRALVKTTLERWLTPEFRAKNPDVVKAIGDMIAATPPEGYAACCLALRDMDLRSSLRGIRKPVLVIVGRHDASTAPAAGHSIAAAIPGARVHTLEAAHLSNVEASAAFTEAVMGFLAGHDIGVAPTPPEPEAAAPTPHAPKSAMAPKAVPKPAKPAAEPRPVAAKAAPAKTAAAKKPAAKKPAVKAAKGKKPAAKKAAKKIAKKAASRKTAIKKTVAKKRAAKKPAARKATSKKVSSKKTSARKSTSKPASAKKPVVKKASKKSGKKSR